MRPRRGLGTVEVVVLLALLCGCASRPEPVTWRPRPDWVKWGTLVVNRDQGRMIEAVGSALPEPDADLQHGVAVSNARRELAEMARVYIAGAVMNVCGGQAPKRGELLWALVSDLPVKDLTDWKVVDAWEDWSTGKLYVLIRMPFAEVLKQCRARLLLSAGEHFPAFYGAEANHNVLEFDHWIDSEIRRASEPLRR